MGTHVTVFYDRIKRTGKVNHRLDHRAYRRLEPEHDQGLVNSSILWGRIFNVMGNVDVRFYAIGGSMATSYAYYRNFCGFSAWSTQCGRVAGFNIHLKPLKAGCWM